MSMPMSMCMYVHMYDMHMHMHMQHVHAHVQALSDHPEDELPLVALQVLTTCLAALAAASLAYGAPRAQGPAALCSRGWLQP